MRAIDGQSKLRRWSGRLFCLADMGRAYRLTFNMSAASQLVLKDLAEVAKVNHPQAGFDPDPYVNAFNMGKRAMWQHIQNHLRLDDSQLMALYTDGNLHREDN